MKQYEKLSAEMLANSEGWKPRFVISDFVAMLSEDSVYADKASPPTKPDTESLFVDNDTQSFVVWSGQDSYSKVPEVGMKIKSRVPVNYDGIVRGHYFAYGYVGIKVEPYPWFQEALSKCGYGKLPSEGVEWTESDLVYNYGVDLLEANYDFIYKEHASNNAMMVLK